MSAPDPEVSAGDEPRDILAPPPAPAAAPARRPRFFAWCLGITAVGVLLGAMLCGGGSLWLVKLGLDVFTADIEELLRDNEVLLEHLGQLEEIELDMVRSMAKSDVEEFVFQVRGTLASGTVTTKSRTDEDGEEILLGATLRLESGKVLDLMAR
jgi:hypothetical protein